jgi:hypothetical protein
MASTITVSSLAATAGYGQNFLSWNYSNPNSGLTGMHLDAIEVWAATANDRTAASKIDERKASQFVHVFNDGDPRWYWARARDNWGNFGDWFPSSPTAGITAGDTASLGQNGYIKHAGGLIEQWGRDALTGGGASTTITFPIAFPNQCFQVTANALASPSASITRSIQVETFDTATVLLNGNQIATPGNVTAPAMTALWRALGF